jgi:metal-dependent amidase/aminoacylase/carboxypeptidase family protein
MSCCSRFVSGPPLSRTSSSPGAAISISTPELGDQAKRTVGIVAKPLQSLDIDGRTGLARNGILRGGKPGPVVALRADMDALLVNDPQKLPFASKQTGKYLGEQHPAAAPNHNPEFSVHEPALEVGARAMASMAVSFLASGD